MSHIDHAQGRIVLDGSILPAMKSLRFPGPFIEPSKRKPQPGAAHSLVYYVGFRGCAGYMTGERESCLAFARVANSVLDWPHAQVWALSVAGVRVIIK